MTEIKGIFAASMSILDKNLTLDLNKTIIHAENLIDQGCHGVAIFGSTGQAQLISVSEKISLLNIILVFIITIITLILILDTFKNPISTLIPNINFLLESLYETLNDIILKMNDDVISNDIFGKSK